MHRLAVVAIDVEMRLSGLELLCLWTCLVDADDAFRCPTTRSLDKPFPESLRTHLDIVWHITTAISPVGKGDDQELVTRAFDWVFSRDRVVPC